MQILREAGVPVAAVLDTLELSYVLYLWRREMFMTVQHSVRCHLLLPGRRVKMSDPPVEVVRESLLGEQTAAVYREWMGLDEVQVAPAAGQFWWQYVAHILTP